MILSTSDSIRPQSTFRRNAEQLTNSATRICEKTWRPKHIFQSCQTNPIFNNYPTNMPTYPYKLLLGPRMDITRQIKLNTALRERGCVWETHSAATRSERRARTTNCKASSVYDSLQHIESIMRFAVQYCPRPKTTF